jgi:hypothetical protein
MKELTLPHTHTNERRVTKKLWKENEEKVDAGFEYKCSCCGGKQKHVRVICKIHTRATLTHLTAEKVK